jgi:bifunctional DNase/RNase
MKCQQCVQQATLHITEAHEGAARGELHLCPECAQTYLYDSPAPPVEDHRPGGPHNGSGEYRIEVVRLIISETEDHQVIVFREVGGPRSFPLVVGIFEVTSIDRTLRGMKSPRPLTHDGWLATITALGAELRSAGIDALQEHTYFASLRLGKAGGFGRPVTVDLRPSDAVVVALLARVPLFIPDALLTEVSANG